MSLRLCTVLLLLLGISPVTAPFLTCDLVELLGERSSESGAILQAKAATDEPVASSSVSPRLPIVGARATTSVIERVALFAGRADLRFPLRI